MDLNDIATDYSNNPNLDYITGKDPEDVKKQLKQLKLPYKILFAVPFGARIVVFFSPSKPIKKITVQEDKEPVKALKTKSEKLESDVLGSKKYNRRKN